MNFFERRKVFKNTNALDLVPVRKVEHQIEEAGNVTIIIPKFRNDKFAKFALGNRKRHIFIHLDEIGTFTWLAIDGLSNIRAISEKLKEHFGESLLESEQRVNKFMSRLYQERYITFRQLEEAEKTSK
jgi:hypothetical protein